MMYLFQDARHATRSLRRNPMFSIAALVVLSSGIGSCTAVFSVIYPSLLQTIPTTGSNKLVLLRWTAREIPEHIVLEGPPGYTDQHSGISFPFASFEDL